MYLQEADGELGVLFSGDPQPEGVLNALGLDDVVHHLLHVVQRQVAVLKQQPAALRYALLQHAPGVHLLTLTHGDGTALWEGEKDDVT